MAKIEQPKFENLSKDMQEEVIEWFNDFCLDHYEHPATDGDMFQFDEWFKNNVSWGDLMY